MSLNVVAKAAGQIILADGKAIETEGGDIVLWANTGNKQSGTGQHYMRLTTGSSWPSGGGTIVLAGGLDTNTDGYPDGYAYIGDVVRPAGSVLAGDPLQPGVSLGSVRDQTGARITINSGGGDVIIRGRSGVANTQADGFGSQRAVVIDAGSGSIQIEGDQVAAGGGVGLRFGNLDYYPDVAITSGSTSTPAIQIVGTSVNNRGVWLGDGTGDSSPAGTVLLQTTSNSGGGITLEGSSSQSSGDTPGIALSGTDTSGFQEYQFLSNGGDILLVSKRDTANSKISVRSETFLGQRKNAAAVQGVSPIAGASSVKTTFQADRKISFKKHLDGVGSIVIKPFTAGKSIGLGTSSGADLEIEGLAQIDNTHSLLTIGDANSNGISSVSPISLTASTIFISGSDALSFTGNLTSTNNLTLDVAGNSSVGLLNLGTGSLTKEGAGILNLTAANSYSGATNINAGTLQLSNTDLSAPQVH